MFACAEQPKYIHSFAQVHTANEIDILSDKEQSVAIQYQRQLQLPTGIP